MSSTAQSVKDARRSCWKLASTPFAATPTLSLVAMASMVRNTRLTAFPRVDILAELALFLELGQEPAVLEVLARLA
eukprot:11169716-Lingulodinium_polyedra.AAC.1